MIPATGAGRGDAPRLTRVAAVGALIAAALASIAFLEPINTFDGGIAASAATFTLHGLLPYSDYWLLYGPLSGFLLAVPTALFGPSIELLRVVGLGLITAQAAFVTLLASRWTFPAAAAGTGVLSVVATATISGLEPSAWSLAMMLALAALWLRSSGAAPFKVGLVVGLTFASRLDVGGYLLVACMVLPHRRELLVGFASVAAPLAALVLATTDPAALFEQLVWYPIVGPREFRWLPGLESGLHPAEVAIMTPALILIPRLVILGGAFRTWRERSGDIAALVVFAGLCQLQTLGRADAAHFAMAATPGILLGALWIRPIRFRDSVPRAVISAASIALGVVLIMSSVALGALREISKGPDGDLSLRRSIAAVERLTTRDDPIFVGLVSNRITLANPLVAYYLADRRPGTTKTMFNPGITNTDATQRVMTHELEASGTDLMILGTTFAHAFEPENGSAVLGSTVLDDYIGANYREVCDFGQFVVYLRIAVSDGITTCPVS